MKRLNGTNIILKDELLLQKEAANRSYLMELQSGALLQNYYLEAGIGNVFNGKKLLHSGWEDPTCQLRGHFLGHYLSACAVRYHATGDRELLAKADAIVHELRFCQLENGNGWAASIPEKYLHWIARGKGVWAPHYTVHKTFLGLVDMYRYGHNEEALQIAHDFARWFLAYTDDKSRDELDNILDVETGGMLEIWADLYEFTGDDMYLTLIDRYDRHRLFDPLLEGVDVLTNMHANTTIPEAIGAARVYEVTGKERYRDIALRYWDLAVTKRGYFVTGGQTNGEIWTPMFNMANRLGDKNQEHCTVYNMIRLADILFTWTGDHQYVDYIEQNLYNGIVSQGYFHGNVTNGQEYDYPTDGLITYFQPLRAGAKKGWGTKFSDFFCCHGTLVQANAAHNRYLFYQDGDALFTGIYADAELTFEAAGKTVHLTETRDTLSGSFHSSSTSSAGQAIREATRIYENQPDCMKQVFTVSTDGEAEFTINFRLPKWLKKDPVIYVNGQEVTDPDASIEGYLGIRRAFATGDVIELFLPLTLYTTPLDGDPDMIAFSYGPFVLAGLCDAERTLYLHGNAPEDLLVHDNEREWGSWKNTFKTKGQDPAIRLVPLHEIGYERYQVYFPVVR